MIHSAHISEDYADGYRIRGMGFVIETDDGDGGKVLLVKDVDSIWSAMYVDDDDCIGNGGQSTEDYRVISQVPCTASVSHLKPIPALRGEEYHWMNVLALARGGCTDELDRLFSPAMERMGWAMTEKGMAFVGLDLPGFGKGTGLPKEGERIW